ncbi:MAG: hypothetical protein ACLR17_13635 [Enterobacteriaceae bacterium]
MSCTVFHWIKGAETPAAYGAQRVVKPLVKELASGAQRSLEARAWDEAQPRGI